MDVYNRRFTWLVFSQPQDATYSGPVATWTAAGKLWGLIKNLSAQRQTVFGATFGRVAVEIHLPGWPAVSERDRLVDDVTGDTYELDALPQKECPNGKPKKLVCVGHVGQDVQT